MADVQQQTIYFEIKGNANNAVSAFRRLGNEMDKTAKKASSFGKLMDSFKRIAYYRVIRSVIKSITQAFTEGLEKAYLFSSGIVGEGHRFAEAMDNMKSATNQMKGQLGSAFISLLTAIEPILISIINLVTRAADAISQLLAAFTGTTYIRAQATAAQFSDAMSKGARAAKEWKNQLMGFDVINRLEEPSKGGGGGGTNPLEGYKFEETPINENFLKVADTIKRIVATIQEELPKIDGILALFPLALGAILTFSGANIPLGLALMAAGAYKIATDANQDWSNLSGKVQMAIGEIMAILGWGLMAVGAILLFSGVKPALGLGLIAAGVTMNGAIAMNWSNMPAQIQSVVNKIMLILGGASLAIGVLLAFACPAKLPLALGLIIAGASTLATSALLNWDYLQKQIEDKISGILMIGGALLAAVGVALLFMGHPVLGLSMILAGFTAFGVGRSMVNWDETPNKILQRIESIRQGLQGLCQWIQSVLDGFSLIFQANGGGYSQFSGWAADVHSITGRASGGYVPNGELFVAQERGPEMIGTIGGRTAVANNDQIVEAIKAGVYEAVVSGMSGSGGNNQPIIITMDGKEIARTTTKYQNQMARAGAY